MKILYVSPQNTVGTLSLWQEVHRSRGNDCRFVTMFPSQTGFEDDICLDLPFAAGAKIYQPLRNLIYKMTRGPLGDEELREGNPPIWEPDSLLERMFFALRDWLWRSKIERAIIEHDLLDFDVYHFEWGQDLYRNGDFITRVAAKHKPMLATYHGQDFRNRGVIPIVNDLVDLSLTSELDLLPRHPNLKYLFLPYDVEAFQPRETIGDLITISHATRNRYVKGSDVIIEACESLAKSHGVRFLLIEDRPHHEVMAAKAASDIYIDQVADLAPGFGMNSIEAMSLGVACVTSMNRDYEKFMPHHPFVNVTPDDLLTKLTSLVENPDVLQEYGRRGRRWAEQMHSLSAAGDQLYGYYLDIGIEV